MQRSLAGCPGRTRRHLASVLTAVAALHVWQLAAAAAAADGVTAASAGATGTAAEAKRSLPAGSLIVGYGTSCREGADFDHTVAEVRAGVNVIIWFATNLAAGKDGQPQVTSGQNHTCVALMAKRLRELGLATAHMISIGGWDAPHPNTAWSGGTWATAWTRWNREQVAVPSLGFAGYDGVDWDLEGNDNQANAANHFTLPGMALVGEMSQALKAAGFLVSLVPPQSYLDVSTSAFDRSLLHGGPHDFHPNFTYHGHNAYALWLAKYGRTELDDAGRGLATFDFVDVQLYETYSPANRAINGQGQHPARYLVDWVRAIERGWRVDFGTDKGVQTPSQNVSVPPSQLVVGFSHGNGSPPHDKSVFIEPGHVAEAWAALSPAERPRGVMFWNIRLDGQPSWYPNGTSTNVTFAREFNRFLHVRP